MMIKTSVGIEMAGRDLRVAILRSSFGRISFSRSAGISGFLDLPPDEQKTSIEKLIKTHRIPGARVFLSLPRDLGIVRQVEFPVEVKEKLRPAVELQLETLCPWPAEEVYWDCAHQAVSSGAKSMIVTVAIIPKHLLNPWIEFFGAVKLPLSGASLSSLVHGHGAASLWSDSAATLVLGCEAEHLEGSLIQGGRINSLSVKGPSVPEQAKVVVDRLLSSGRVSSPESTRLVVYGATAVQLESPPVLLPIQDARPESAGMFGAIASALMGFRKTGFFANLVPRALRYRRSQLQLVPTYALIALTILLGFALMVRESYQFSNYARSIDREIAQISPEVREVSSQEAELNGLSEKYRALSTHFESRDRNLEALRELARILPASAWLGNYSYQDGNMTLSGFADSAAEVQKALEDSPLFKDVQFTSSLTRDSNGKDRFNLKAAIEVSR